MTLRHLRNLSLDYPACKSGICVAIALDSWLFLWSLCLYSICVYILYVAEYLHTYA